MDDTIPQDIPQKQCNRCKQYKPATSDFFHADRSKKDGFSTLCIVCKRSPKPALPPVPDGYKRCRTCGQVKPSIREFFAATAIYASPDGLNKQCKVCRSTYRRNLHKDEPKKPQPRNPSKPCHYCGRSVPATLDFFCYDKSKRDRLSYGCRECRIKLLKDHRTSPHGKNVRQEYYRLHADREKARRKEYRRLHKEQEKNYAKQYREAHKEQTKTRYYHYIRSERGRALKSASVHRRLALKRSVPGTHTPEQIKALLKQQRYRCYYCQKRFQQVKGKYVYHIDHTIPLSRTDMQPRNSVDHIVLTCPQCNLQKGDRCPWEWPEGGKLL